MKPPRPDDLPPRPPRGAINIHLPAIQITFGQEVYFTQPVVLKAELLPPPGQPAEPIPGLNLSPPPATPPDTPAPANPELPPFALCREPGCWKLVFEGRQTHLKHEKGILYLSYLLQHPRQLIHGVDLFTKFQPRRRKSVGLNEIVDPETGQTVILESHARLQEKNLAKSTEEENRQNLKEIAKVYSEQLRNPATSEAQLAFARQQLEHIASYLNQHHPDNVSPRDGIQKAARSVRQAIYRFRDHLRALLSQAHTPDPALARFVDHLFQYLIVPSTRYSGHNARLARAELAGSLIYEPPPGILWAISS